jgi:hypothetical protein
MGLFFAKRSKEKRRRLRDEKRKGGKGVSLFVF